MSAQFRIRIQCTINKTMPQTNQRSKGFTLIEAVVVLVVLSLLISMAYPAVEKVREKYREIEIVRNLETIAEAGLSFIKDHSVDSVNYSMLTEGDYVNDFSSVFGEDYSSLEVIGEGGLLLVVDKNGKVIKLFY